MQPASSNRRHWSGGSGLKRERCASSASAKSASTLWADTANGRWYARWRCDALAAVLTCPRESAHSLLNSLTIANPLTWQGARGGEGPSSSRGATPSPNKAVSALQRTLASSDAARVEDDESDGEHCVAEYHSDDELAGDRSKSTEDEEEPDEHKEEDDLHVKKVRKKKRSSDGKVLVCAGAGVRPHSPSCSPN